MSAWHKVENVFRQLNRLQDTPVPTLADSPGEELPCEWTNRTVDMLVIDVSPSMDTTDCEPSRLAGAIHAATRFLRRRAETEPDSLLGVITFSKNARMIVPPRLVKAALEETTNALQGISSSLKSVFG
jgi:von Willebrand factor type A domain